jgi:hypothetical protein
MAWERGSDANPDEKHVLAYLSLLASPGGQSFFDDPLCTYCLTQRRVKLIDTRRTRFLRRGLGSNGLTLCVGHGVLYETQSYSPSLHKQVDYWKFMRAADKEGKRKDNKKTEESTQKKRRISNALFRKALAPRVAV